MAAGRASGSACFLPRAFTIVHGVGGDIRGDNILFVVVPTRA